MKFGCLNELIEFEENLEWIKDDGSAYPKLDPSIKAKYDRLKGNKYIGFYNGRVISVVSDEFKAISVKEIACACDNEFGEDFVDKSYREGIVRIYDQGVEDSTGKVTPLVIFPANLGTMAVKLGIYHNASVCANGMIITDNALTERIVHRLSVNDLNQRVKRITRNLSEVLSGVGKAQELILEPGLQLAMIVQGLNKSDNLIKKAVSRYLPEDKTLWSTIQAITYVATHETKNGYGCSKNAGNYLLSPVLDPCDIVDAACYVFAKQSKGIIDFPGASGLFSMAREVLV